MSKSQDKGPEEYKDLILAVTKRLVNDPNFTKNEGEEKDWDLAKAYWKDEEDKKARKEEKREG